MRYALVVLLLALPACDSGDESSTPTDPSGTDTTPPAAVTDLQVVSYDVGQITVTWTAPGDDGAVGTASEYRIAFDDAPITEASWPACSALFAPLAPSAAGSRQSAQIDAPPTPDVYVALTCVDDAGNWSPLSNVAHGQLSANFEVVQLTVDGNNRYPCLDGIVVTWVGWTEGGEEIFIANVGAAFPMPTVLTRNGGEKRDPSSHGSEKIVWSGRLGPTDDWEIYVYSASAVPRYYAHTDNTVPDRLPVLAGAGNFAWQHGPTMFEEIFHWNESLHSDVRISHSCCPTDDYSNTAPVADDFTVVFESWHRTGSGNRAATWMWDGTLHDITAEVPGRAYSLDAGTLAYESGSGPTRISYWDGTTVHDVGPGNDPSLDDGWIAYEVHEGGNWEIRLWDGVNTIDITDNDFNDTDPSLSGDRLVWTGRPEGSGGAYQIFFARLPRPGRRR